MTTTLQCPQCGGENSLPSGVRVLRCQFCEAALFVDRSGLVSHYRLPRLLDRSQAQQALRRWMAGNDTVKDLDKKVEAVELAPVVFPMWMFRQRSGGGEVVLAEPAAAIPEPALADLQVPAGKLEPFREGADEAAEGPAGGASDTGGDAVGDGVERIEATVPLDTARTWLGQAGGAAAEVTETALVHVPLWRARYRYGDRSFTALVEASTGVVFASVFPEKAETPYWAVAILGILLFGAEGLLITDVVAKLLVYAVTSLPLLGLAWWVTRRV